MRLAHLIGRALVAAGLAAAASGASALTPEQASRIAAGDSDARIEALNAAAADPALAAYVQALLADEVKLVPGEPPRALRVQGSQVVDAATGAPATLPDDAQDVVNNNRMRRELEAMAATLALLSPERAAREQAIAALADGVDASRLPLIDRALAAETDETLKLR
ncbi:MAG: urea ABC transporter permease subunit UrtB, partial [Burkholderiales bacterium]|nr:urea ABC transporter permease subunit UrtB [Burkholderiales bacterium]